MSQAEAMLALQIQAVKLPKPERQYKFHPKRAFRADFCWPANRLIVEVQGGVWNNGAHVRGAGYERDCERMIEAQLLGHRILYVTPAHIQKGSALEWIERALEAA